MGWIGALRGTGQPPFAARELRRLRSAAPAIADALVQADAAESAQDPIEGCDLVLDASGRIELASAAAAPIIDHPERAAMVAAWARSADRDEAPPRVVAGQRISWSRLVGSGGVRYLLRLEPVEAVRLRSDFELSATQRRVAEYAAAGAQVSEIGEAVGIAPTTVKTHLRAVYATLGIGSRAELAQALQRELPG